MKSLYEQLLEQANVNAQFLKAFAPNPQRTVSQSDTDAVTAAERDKQAQEEPGAFK